MYDDEGEYEDDEEENFAANAEAARREGAELTRGKDERAFYDGLAKQEDAKHNAMRADISKRSLMLGDIRQKLRHRETELHAIEAKIRDEEERIDYELKRAYRLGGDGDVTDNEEIKKIPILSRDIDKNDVGVEFSIERAKANIKQLEIEKQDLKKIVDTMRATMHDEERAISQLQHTLLHS